MGSAFTQVLANIYMLEWEQDLIKYQASKNEIYGRHKKLKKQDINIEIESTINTSVNYLDLTIKNENGQLRTFVYHKPTAEPYYLPITSDHPHKYHRNIPCSALIRAARLCSHVHGFNLERLRIKMSLLLSQYPPKFISNQFLRFFQVNNAERVLQQFGEHVYKRLHQQLINRTTQKQKKLNDSMKDPVRYPAVLEKKPWNRTVMYPQYLLQSGPITNFSRQFFS